MSNSQKTPAADRHHGGPGSSHQDQNGPRDESRHDPQPNSPTNTSKSQVSGGGGERDRHHTHDAADRKTDRSH